MTARKSSLLLVLLLCLAAVVAREAALGAAAAPAKKAEPAEPAARPRPAVIDDARILRTLEVQAARLMEAGKTAPMANLVAQLGRTSCTLALPKPSGRPLAQEDLYERCKASVLVVAGIYKCDKCGRNHASTATGFVLTESGAAATNYHVVNNAKNLTLVAATADGKVYPVKAVLAASAVGDVAVVQLDASGLAPLAVAPPAPVGSDVYIISHPDRRFFSLSKGIVARYGTVVREGKRSPMLQVTAEYAKGSSGGPVLNSAGDAVGMVSSTVSIYYDDDHGKQENLQMVLNQCVPAAQILDLIRSP